MERKRTKKKYIVIPAAALDLLGIGTGAVLANDKIKLIDDKVVIKAGTKMDLDISKYVDVPKSKLKKLKIDTSKVDTSKVGEYEMTVTYKEQVLTLKVKVTDTLAPVIEKPKKALKAKVLIPDHWENWANSSSDPDMLVRQFEDLCADCCPECKTVIMRCAGQFNYPSDQDIKRYRYPSQKENFRLEHSIYGKEA